MKKLTALLLVFTIVFSLSSAAFASGEASSGELPTEIPESVEIRITAPVYIDGENVTIDGNGKEYTATKDDQSCVYAKNGAVYTVEGVALLKPSGILSTATSFVVPTGEVLWNTTEAGSYGINAAVLAWGEGTELTIKDCNIWSYNMDASGEPIADDEALTGANAAFATMGGTLILDNVDIIAAGEGGHGMDVTSGGVIHIRDSSVVTYGKKASGLTTDQPGGTIYAENVTVLTYKSGSAPVYCDGNSFVSLDGGTLESWTEPGAVVCTDGVLELTDVKLIAHNDAALNAHFNLEGNPSQIRCTGCTFMSDTTSAVTTYADTEMTFENCLFYPAEGAYIAASVEGNGSMGQMEANDMAVTMRDCRLRGGFYADTAAGATISVTLENTNWVVTVESNIDAFVIDESTTVEGTMLMGGVATVPQPGVVYENVIVMPN